MAVQYRAGGEIIGPLRIESSLYVRDGISNENVITVVSRGSLPNAVNGVITLQGVNETYVVVGDVDLMGDRIVFDNASSGLLGTTSETSFLRSTGLSDTLPLVTAPNTLAIQNISLDAPYALHLGSPSSANTSAYDLRGVNILNSGKSVIDSCRNFIYDTGAFLNSDGLEFVGVIGTVGVFNSLFVGRNNKTIMKISPTASITRRFRIIYSSFSVPTGGVGVNFDVGVTVPTESYILDTVNFSGVGSYTSGVDLGSNKTLIINCVGVENTSVNGQLYMNDNATPTVIASVGTFVKVSGVTTPSGNNQKYTASTTNRLTCDALINRKFLISTSVSFNGVNNNVYAFGIYSSKRGGISPESIVKTTANASGRAENVTLFAIEQAKSGDYFELWVKNITGVGNATITDMNMFAVTL